MSLYRYVLLRNSDGDITGYMQYLAAGEDARIIVEGSVPPDILPLRALLVSTQGDDAVLDLGRLRGTDRQCLSLRWQGKTHPGLWDAAILAEDWPSGKLYAVGMIDDKRHTAAWQLARAAANFLRLPREDSPSALFHSTTPAASVLSLPL